MRQGFIGAVLLGLAVLAAPPALAEEARLPVVATFSVLGDMAKAIGGEHVAVTTLVGPDSDTHSYEPTPRDAQTISAAKLLITNGLGLEGWLDRLRSAAQFKGTVVVATAGIAPLTIAEDEGGAGARAGKRVRDPHAWQSAANGEVYADNIMKGLVAADPAHADDYRRRADAYRAELAALDKTIRETLADIPKEKRRVITTHDAFQYYGQAYGVAFLAPLGVTTESEPSAGDLAKLERQIRREHIKALFLENVTSPRLIAQIAKETGAVLGPPLYSDALSKPDAPAGTYLTMLEYNTAVLKAGMLKN
ncbi:MAG TPA: metal ABC transporter substrate-binding protein [Stellaceae bacterium]|nr:metal ABC transporter substrate-binding protein [Stellaceae bacterium]